MLILKTLFCILIAVGVAESACYEGAFFSSFTESNLAINGQGCFRFFVGSRTTPSRILLALTYNQIACDNGQNFQILDQNENLYYDVCQYIRTGVQKHFIAFDGNFLILQFSSQLAQLFSTFIHYGLFDQIDSPPTTNAPSTTTLSTVRPTTASAAPTTSAAASPTTARAATCGVPRITPNTSGLRIVGGTQAVSNSWPWQALIYTTAGTSRYMCGGTLISDEWIVTAAHCIVGSGQTIAYLGINSQREATSANAYPVIQQIRHPGYNSRSLQNDIALMKLGRKVTFTDKIQPICLPASNLATLGRAGIVTGWGDTSTDGSPSVNLLQVTIPVQEWSYCRTGFQQISTQFCAGEAGAKDSCQGDSGGPLVLQDGGRFVLSGVVSYGVNGCDGRGVYTNVFSYVNWIQSTIAAN